MFGNMCPMCVARQEQITTLRARLDSARELLRLTIQKQDDIIEIMRQNDLKLDDLEDPMQKLALTIYTDLAMLATKADAWLAEDGEE